MPDPASITLSREEALAKAAKQFRFYEQQHMAKGNLDGDAKARTNCEFAEMCEAALAAPARAAPAVPTERVLALAKEWRAVAEVERENTQHPNKSAAWAFDQCAAALEALAKEAGNG